MWVAGTHVENELSAGGLGGGGGRAAGHASRVGDEQGGAHSRLALTQLSPGRHRHLQTEGLSISKIPGWTRNPSRPH